MKSEAKNKIKQEASFTLRGIERLAEKEHLSVEWVIEEFQKEFNRIIKKYNI